MEVGRIIKLNSCSQILAMTSVRSMEKEGRKKFVTARGRLRWFRKVQATSEDYMCLTSSRLLTQPHDPIKPCTGEQ